MAKLLAAFFQTDDQNLRARHDFFYRELAPSLELYRVRVGDVLTIKAFTRSGYVQSVNVPVYGTFQFQGLEKSTLAGALNLMDLVSFRELYGFLAEREAGRDQGSSRRRRARASHTRERRGRAVRQQAPPATSCVASKRPPARRRPGEARSRRSVGGKLQRDEAAQPRLPAGRSRTASC